MKKKSMMLPFTVDEKYNINYMKGKGMENIVSVNSLSMLRNMIQKISTKKDENKKTQEKYKFIKASESKKIGGGLEQVIFPAGLSGATAVLGLAALQHAVKKKYSSKKKKTTKK
jgi:hypothetical protein